MEKSAPFGGEETCIIVAQPNSELSGLVRCSPRHRSMDWEVELSRRHQDTLQTLYRWKAKGEQALQNALGAAPLPTTQRCQWDEQVLTLLIEAHASYRGIQTCLRKLCGVSVSLESITELVKLAGQRASEWLVGQCASTPRALALDEQYSSQRGKAYQSAD